jgi:Flp pilus assembly protein TadD
MRLASSLIIAIGLATAVPSIVFAMGSTDPAPAAKPAATVNKDFTDGQAAIKRKDFKAAVAALTRATASEPRNADAFNLLGYAHRNLKEFDPAKAAYAKALTIDPNHRGALEYLGELYLLVNDVAAAEQNLAKLDKICTFGCEEFSELKRKITAFKAGKKSS